MLPGVARGNRENSQTVKATLGLRELLFDGQFRPGERVAELALVDRLGVSRTPLRLALMTLEHEGLLETLPGGGFVVRAFTRSDVDDAIELRGMLEGVAARFAAERLDSAGELEEIRQTTAELDGVVRDESPEALVRFVSLNERFHAALVALAKSGTLAREITRVLALPFASPTALLASHGQLPESREILLIAQFQHRAIVEAIGSGNATRAEELAREHARLSRANLDLVMQHRELLLQLRGAPLLKVV
jgi:GntR family transcriptional regulator of vanillate catabolism